MTDSTVSVQFTEIMRGFILLDEQNNFQQGYDHGHDICFKLTIKILDIDSFINDPCKTAETFGIIDSQVLGGELKIEKGLFNLFVDVGDPDENIQQMQYRLFFTDHQNRKMTLVGYKILKNNGLLGLWSDTTTLYTQVLSGHVDQDQMTTVNATGILRIKPLDFIWQMTTFRTRGKSFRLKISGLLKFFKLFVGSLWDVYGF